MKIDNSEVNRRSIRPGEPVVCGPLNLRFPTVYRIVESATREQLDYYRVYDQEPYTGLNHYSLYSLVDNRGYFGTIERTAISTLDPAMDTVSLVIRYHRSRETARCYLHCIEDFGVDDLDNSEHQTEEGVFTLIKRPTQPNWPGPLIIYCADDMRADKGADWIVWFAAVAPDGTFIEDFDDF
jgi:hypothetical protein